MDLQLKTAPLTAFSPRLNSKVDFFLNLATITGSQATHVKKIIESYVNKDKNKYVLFRHSSLYFFADNTVDFVESTSDDFKDRHYLRFDGEKVTRIDPEYYLGPLNKAVHPDTDNSLILIWENEINSNNNNNNNNNNNGNNNNG
ncbi:MAG TPA: hypothetical protein EYP59_07305 [Thiotrichaceae bacterium]|nr:hypothetical protein [Thiotrichaceae bacterium]